MTNEIWWGLGAVAFVNIALAAIACFGGRNRMRNIVYGNMDNFAARGYFAPGGLLFDASPDEIAYGISRVHRDYRTADLTPYVRKWLRRKGWTWSD